MSAGARAVLLLVAATVAAFAAALLGARLVSRDLVRSALLESAESLRTEAFALLAPGATAESRKRAFEELLATRRSEGGLARLKAFRLLGRDGSAIWSSDPSGGWPEPPEPAPDGKAAGPVLGEVGAGSPGLRAAWFPAGPDARREPALQAVYDASALLRLERDLRFRATVILLIGALFLVLIALSAVQPAHRRLHQIEMGIESALRGEAPAASGKPQRPIRALQALVERSESEKARGTAAAEGLRTLFDHLEEGALLLSSRGEVLHTGRKLLEVFGRRPGEDPAHFWEELARANPDVAERIRATLAGGAVIWKEVAWLSPGPGRQPVEMAWSCFPASAGPPGALLLFRPMAPLRAREELRRSARRYAALLRFLQTASEDLSMPLAGVGERAVALRDDARDGLSRAELTEGLDVLLEEQRRASRILEAFAQVAAVPEDGKREEVDMADLLIESLQEMKPELEAQSKELAFDNRAAEARVAGNRRLLKQAVVGMATFAASIGGRGPVAIALRNDGGDVHPEVCLEVTCGGPPLAPEEREGALRLLARGREGIIPGLAAACFAAEAHDGTLTPVEGPGGETVFVLRLPSLPAVAPPTA